MRESTGLYGESRYAGTSSAPPRSISASLPAELFGEGICQVGEDIWQLTWQERVALRWDASTLELRIGCLSTARAGASARRAVRRHQRRKQRVVRRDPHTLEPQVVVHVRCQGRRVPGLNDLAWSAGTIWANVAGTHYLVGIDPDSGEVTDIVDARPAAERHLGDPQAIMNGIAALPAPGSSCSPGRAGDGSATCG